MKRRNRELWFSGLHSRYRRQAVTHSSGAGALENNKYHKSVSLSGNTIASVAGWEYLTLTRPSAAITSDMSVLRRAIVVPAGVDVYPTKRRENDAFVP